MLPHGRKLFKMKVIVFGGDARQIYCAGRLSLEPSMDVRRIALGEDSCPMGGVGTADILVLPYVSVKDGYLNAPYSSEKIEFDQAYEYVGQGTLVFCGGITEDIRLELDKRGAKIYDWLADEELTLKNAALTAEGAAQILSLIHI